LNVLLILQCIIPRADARGTSLFYFLPFQYLRLLIQFVLCDRYYVAIIKRKRERERGGGGKEYRALVVAKYAHSARICSGTPERALGRACNLLKTRLFRHITSVSATFDTDGQPARYFTDDPPLERPFKTSARNVRLTHGACLLGGGELDRR